MTTDPIDWSSSLWGVIGHNVHHGTTDDLGLASDKHRDETGDDQ